MPVFCGGPERIRTADLCNANAALYQLSYRPGKPAKVRHLLRQTSPTLLTVLTKYASSVLKIFLVYDELSHSSIKSNSFILNRLQIVSRETIYLSEYH